MIAFREIHRTSILLNLRLHTAVVRRFDSTVRTVAGSAGDGNICKGAAQLYTTYTGRFASSVSDPRPGRHRTNKLEAGRKPKARSATEVLKAYEAGRTPHSGRSCSRL